MWLRTSRLSILTFEWIPMVKSSTFTSSIRRLHKPTGQSWLSGETSSCREGKGPPRHGDTGWHRVTPGDTGWHPGTDKNATGEKIQPGGTLGAWGPQWKSRERRAWSDRSHVIYVMDLEQSPAASANFLGSFHVFSNKTWGHKSRIEHTKMAAKIDQNGTQPRSWPVKHQSRWQRTALANGFRDFHLAWLLVFRKIG